MGVALRAAGIAIVALVAIVILRTTSSGFATLVRVAALILLFGAVIFELSSGISTLRELISGFVDSDSIVGTSISVMIRALGIALIGRICADICKECGEGGIAQGVESVTGIVIFSLSLPILAEILVFASDVLRRGS